MTNDKARILIFTGDGKGKTTAALGMAFRASGHGLRSCMVQFIKGDGSVGEVLAAAAAASIDIVQTGLGFLPPATAPSFSPHRQAAQEGLHKAREIISGRKYGLVILDEVCLAVNRGLLEENQVAEVLAEATPNVCLVLTGRGATPGLIALADTVTEMKCLKHGLQAGWLAQEGVER